MRRSLSWLSGGGFSVWCCAVMLIVAWSAVVAIAQEQSDQAEPKDAAKGDEADSKAPHWGDDLVTTEHEVVIAGQSIKYHATAGTMTLQTESGKDRAKIFFVSYTRDGVENVAQRPIVFAFNGGPGSSAIWLHMGMFGPKRVVMDDDAKPVPPPGVLVDNSFSVLDVADLVFIDPVTTGFSRAAEDVNDSEFHGVTEDVQSVGEFIRLYATRFKRWSSPKFIAGESYGTTRAAGLSNYLQDRYGMYLNGVILISTVLNFQTIDFDQGNELPYVLFLPTYTATAWYHKQLSPELQRDLGSTLEQAEAFAQGEYASALFQGDALSSAERASVVTKLAMFCGVSEEFVEQNDLRISMGRFTKELLRDHGRTVGRLDSRFKGMDTDNGGSSPEYDPSYSAIQGPYGATFNNYVRTQLEYESDLPYEILTGRVHPWNYGSARNRYLNVAPQLRSAMTENPALRVFVACGYYDLATPFFASQYTFDHLGLDESLRGHVTMKFYESGHMMYIHLPSLERLRRDLLAFMGDSVAATVEQRSKVGP